MFHDFVEFMQNVCQKMQNVCEIMPKSAKICPKWVFFVHFYPIFSTKLHIWGLGRGFYPLFPQIWDNTPHFGRNSPKYAHKWAKMDTFCTLLGSKSQIWGNIPHFGRKFHKNATKCNKYAHFMPKTHVLCPFLCQNTSQFPNMGVYPSNWT